VDVVLSVIAVVVALSCLAKLMVDDFRDYQNRVLIKKESPKLKTIGHRPGM